MADRESAKVVIINESEKPQLVKAFYYKAPQRDGSFRIIVDQVTDPSDDTKVLNVTPALINQLERFIAEEASGA